MKLIALTDTPQGQAAGQIFEATDDAAKVLIQVGCAKPYIPDTSRTPDDAPTSHDEPAAAPRRSYRRRDLKAED